MIKTGSLFTQVLSLVDRGAFGRAVWEWDAVRYGSVCDDSVFVPGPHDFFNHLSKETGTSGFHKLKMCMSLGIPNF